ncbi:MAG: ferritin family protein [Thermoplasmatales archaeon]|nr:MAG: ferritin family protein [Thermoplasmatales archaeon]
MDEIKNIKDAIKTAIQMEKDGYSFYKKAAVQTSNEMGRSIFESLANDELLHLDVFQKMFQDNVGEEEWKNLVDSSKKYANIKIFPKDLKTMEGVNPESDEMDALRIGMDSEREAIDYYNNILENITDPDMKNIINEIIEQEKNHYLILEQEFNHLDKTGYWFDMDYLGSYTRGGD